MDDDMMNGVDDVGEYSDGGMDDDPDRADINPLMNLLFGVPTAADEYLPGAGTVNDDGDYDPASGSPVTDRPNPAAPPAGNPWLLDKEEYYSDHPMSNDQHFNIFTPFRSAGQVGSITPAPENPGNWNPRNVYDSWSDASGYSANPAAASEANFRPVPYPRPLKAIQIKLRVLEPRSGITREVTLVHYFPRKQPD